MSEPSLIAVDWGSTRRRVALLDRAGAVIDRLPDGAGVLGLSREACAAEAAALQARWPGARLLMAGMIGSDRGLGPVAYLPCPASLDDLAAGLAPWGAGGAIVPGLTTADGDRADVMRGEEVQILGAARAGLVPANALLCQPGTHNKWVRLKQGRIVDFTTVMSGEFFALLRGSGILAADLQAPVAAGAAFDAGVALGLDGSGVQAALFETRARLIRGRLARDDAASFVSGLLIGDDARIGLGADRRRSVHVLGAGPLAALFVRALEVAGARAVAVDADAAFFAGMAALAKRS